MEKGGSNGALVLFNLYAPQGVLAESLNKNGNVIGQATLDQLLRSSQEKP